MKTKATRINTYRYYSSYFLAYDYYERTHTYMHKHRLTHRLTNIHIYIYEHSYTHKDILI